MSVHSQAKETRKKLSFYLKISEITLVGILITDTQESEKVAENASYMV